MINSKKNNEGISYERNIYDYIYDLMAKELNNLLHYSKNYVFDVNLEYEKEYNETLENINHVKAIKNAVVENFISKELKTSFGVYSILPDRVHIEGFNKISNPENYTYEGIYDCWRICQAENGVWLEFIPYKERQAKKEFILRDIYEDSDIVGEYHTIEEVINAANEWDDDTDGECRLVLDQLNYRYNYYETVVDFKY